jgi:hypothetical protein
MEINFQPPACLSATGRPQAGEPHEQEKKSRNGKTKFP